MMNAEAIQEIQRGEAVKASAAALSEAFPGGPEGMVALHKDFAVHDLEKILPERRRARGTMETSSVEAFNQYALGHQEDGASIFVDPDTMSAVAVLNLGTPTAPGHADNIAKFIAKRTASYSVLLAMTVPNTAPRDQKSIAEFFEDYWADGLNFYDADGVEIMPKNAIAAIRKLTIDSMRRLESSEGALSASRSAFESVQATAEQPIPSMLVFSCEPYHGFDQRSFELRLSVHTGGDKPGISLRMIKREKHAEEMAKELCSLIRAGHTIPILIGKYTAAQ